MPRHDSPVAEALAALARALEELDVDWYLFGAQARGRGGAARLTADIDVTVLLRDRSTQSLASCLEQHGFSLRFPDEDFVRQTRVLPVTHSATRIPADIVLGGPGLEEAFLQRSMLRELAGVRLPVVAPEDLITMKILAGREKDREDVAAILAAQVNLDLEAIRESLRMLEEALGQSDLLPAFEAVLAECRGD